jgi:peptidoglycan/LPS O-acetylase OafA/YrhL
MPALDGVRGLAVAAVLLYHGQLAIGDEWVFRGGYLGVSTFFTLSGFLITSLLLVERERTGSVDRRRFWSRRFRRLLPAAWVTLAAAVVYGSGALSFVGFDAADSQVATLRADVLSAVANVANWRFVVAGESYGALFDEPSPVLHFWSLAIEEQFYLLFPLLALGVLALAHGSRRTFGWVIAGLTAASLLLSASFGWSQDRIYFGTDTRASELLLGALLAVLVAGRRMHPSHQARRVIGGGAAVAFVLVIVSWVAVGQSSAWLYHGGFTLYAIGTVAVLLAASQGIGAVSALLSVPALRWLGRISYGVYLYHWLVFQWLDEELTGLAPWPLLVVRVGVTLGLATLSYRYLEEPVRTRQLLRPRQARRVIPLAAAGLVVALLLVTIDPPEPTIDFAAAESEIAELEVAPIEERPDPADAARAAEPPEPPQPRVAMFGDSTALMTGLGLSSWMQVTGEALGAGGHSPLGCGIGRGGELRTSPYDTVATTAECDAWADRWAQARVEGQPDMAVVQVGPWDVADRRLPGDDTWRAPGDAVYDDFLRSEMVEAIDVLSADGALVVWVTSPAIGPGESGNEIERRGSASDPARMARFNELMREAAAERPEDAIVVDLAEYLTGRPDDVRLRPDGVHFSWATAEEVARDWLGPTLVRLFDQRWDEQWRAAAAD